MLHSDTADRKEHITLTATCHQEYNWRKKKQVPLLQREVCKARQDTKYCMTNEGPNTRTPQTMGAGIHQHYQQNYCLRTESSRSHRGEGLDLLYFALDSAVIKAQNLFRLHRGFLKCAMYHQREAKKQQNN